MPVITAVGTANPDYVLEQNEIKEFARQMFGSVFPNIDRLAQAYDNAQIHRRHFCVPLEWFGAKHSFREKNDLYIRNALSPVYSGPQTMPSKGRAIDRRY